MRRSAAGVIAVSALLALGGAAAAAPRVEVPNVTLERVGTTDPVHRSLDYVSATHSLTLSYPGATYVKVHVERLTLLPGDWLTIADAKGGQAREYRFGLAGQWAMSVDGDTAVLTLHGRLARLTGFGVTVDRVAHGDPGTERSHRPESVCGNDDSRDAVCYKSTDPVAYRNSRAVARLLINGDELCSAWRVGPNNRMFTNHHCFTSTVDARNTEVWFNYECAVCGGFATLPPVKVTGDTVLATDATLDFTLFSVQNFAAVRAFGYLSLDPRDPPAGEQLYIPEHPGGEPSPAGHRTARARRQLSRPGRRAHDAVRGAGAGTRLAPAHRPAAVSGGRRVRADRGHVAAAEEPHRPPGAARAAPSRRTT